MGFFGLHTWPPNIWLLTTSLEGNSQATYGNRNKTIIAWLAYNAGDYSLAEEVIRVNMLDTVTSESIKIMIHCQLDRPEEAMEIIEDTLERFKEKGKKPGFSYQAMRSLAKCVSARGDEKIQQEFADLCVTLDKKAEMNEESIEELLL